MYKNDTGLVSVTEAFSPFISWDKIPQATLAAACERGIEVHQAIASGIVGEYYIINDSIKGYVDAADKFMLAAATDVLLVEERLCCDLYQFTGQVDMVCSIHGKITVIDWKTSETLSKSWPLQLAAYRYLAEKRLGEKIERMMAVQLAKTGKYKICEYLSDKKEFARFLNALSTFQYFNPPRENIDWEVL